MRVGNSRGMGIAYRTQSQDGSAAAAPGFCDPFWSAISGYCSDELGNFVTQQGRVVPFETLNAQLARWIPGVDNSVVVAVAVFLGAVLFARSQAR